jgi:dihydroorotate dehydrogenase electron transfer subunit
MKGPFTKHLGKMRKGDVIGIRGPIGNGFEIKGDRLLLVGGGIGTAPIAPLAEYANNQGKKVTVVVGATTKNELLFIDRIKKTGAKIFITTNDGSMGKKGNTTDITKKLMEEKSFDQCFACGPEIMMTKLLNQARNAGIPIQLSIERYFKCGIGICGHCAIDPGLRVCTEGPVFTGDELGYEFGRYHRDASGRKIIFKEV